MKRARPIPTVFRISGTTRRLPASLRWAGVLMETICKMLGHKDEDDAAVCEKPKEAV